MFDFIAGICTGLTFSVIYLTGHVLLYKDDWACVEPYGVVVVPAIDGVPQYQYLEASECKTYKRIEHKTEQGK